MTEAKFSVLTMCLTIGLVYPVRSDEPQSMAASLAKQTFYPMSWAAFMTSGEPDTKDSLIRNVTGVHPVAPLSLAALWGEITKSVSVHPSHRASLAAMYQSISSSQTTSLAAFMSAKDPASDLVHKLVAETGLDRDEDIKLPASSRSSPDLPIEGSHAQRFNLRSIDVQGGTVSNIQPLAQDQPKSSTSWESSVSRRSKSGVQSLYRDMDDDVNQHHVAEKWGELAESGAAELSHGLKRVTPKAVVKVLHQDVISHKPMTVSGAVRLGKRVEKYSADVESNSVEESSPVSVSSLPKLYLHHGKSHQPHGEQEVDHLKVNPDDMVTVSKATPEDHPSQTLARQMASHIEAEKMRELREHVAEKNKLASENPVEIPAIQQEEPETSKNSVISSVHRPHQGLKFKVLPEDVHHEEVAASIAAIGPADAHNVTGNVTDNEMGAHPPPPEIHGDDVPADSQRSSVPSAKSDWELQFNENAVDGHLDGKGMEKVLSTMTSIKNPGSWNWKRFDLDGDGSLSHREFMNAKQVAMRFKSKK